ncbi:hypothetical protein [Streptomyces bambusae]|uniref:Uncharacterized protein n=1 Tax=Streptomyces bambusae TaxID=1550616 RepID=A0ABS6ZDU6_9ACTN|nr:hypothetical protein [Streptomyces bambusae]MBW5485891.1 hypothetical protein [Streptomyces bambusae]
MSTPPPPQSPGPYGPPHQPTPYGGQAYPQHQPPPYPQQGYPGPPQQPPHPGRAPWGQPPMGPPPAGSGNNTGKVIGIVAASLVGLLVLGYAVTRVNDARTGAGGSGFPAAEYRLTVPNTLVGGTYKLDEDLSQTKGREAIDGSHDPNARDLKPAVGQYTSASAADSGVLVISGMYGRLKHPEEARRKMLAGAADSEGSTVAVQPKDITPSGSGITVSCQVLTARQDGATATVPMCAWADGNTAASVAVVTAATSRQSPASVDLARLAETTLKVRAEVRQPIG